MFSELSNAENTAQSNESMVKLLKTASQLESLWDDLPL